MIGAGEAPRGRRAAGAPPATDRPAAPAAGRPSPERAGTIRAFLGVPLPGAIQDTLAVEVRSLQGLVDGVSWVRAENVHVTVKFLGSFAEAAIGPLCAAIDAALPPATGPLTLEVTGLGAFPSAGRASVIWVGVQDAPAGALAAVAAAVDGAAAGFGVGRETRPFRAHATLGRARRRPVDLRAPVGASAGRAFGAFQPDALVFYESRLEAAGSRYIERGRVPLGQGARSHGR